MLKNLLLNLIGKAVQKYLALDSSSTTRILAMGQKSLKVELLGLGFDFVIKANGDRLEFLSESVEPFDALLRGTPVSLAKLWCQQTKDETQFPKDVDMIGDVEFIQQVSELFRDLDIDWEELLASVTGDIPAHQIGNLFREASSFLSSIQTTAKENTKEYLQEELQLLPTRYEMDEFKNNVSDVRNGVERLAARIARLER